MAKERFKVLLVDDEKDFVDRLSERLKLRDLDADIAYNGEEALQALSRGDHGVMVLDLRMPGIDGLEVLRRVRREHPELRVVILTGHGTEYDAEEAKRLGAFEYMHKPVNIDELDSTLRRAWRSLGRMRDNVDCALMAAAFGECGLFDYADEVMRELDPEQKADAKKKEAGGT
ncbi:response regulator [Desulfohalovibrio reitneri]|uniref:response regulator n=1 Tax=Desulfohalovibrio reitneri TaxID=1307759 RepID=UPI0004A6AAA9|nr:response regulator [Desulfohalovibrio reitneri]